MPAASAKAEIKASHEVFDPIKQALILVDRKVRNLEKRKVRKYTEINANFIREASLWQRELLLFISLVG